MLREAPTDSSCGLRNWPTGAAPAANNIARQLASDLSPLVMTDLKLFSGNANKVLSRQIADYLGVPLGQVSLGQFPDGEISCKINEDIRGRDVYLLQPTCPPVNDNLMQLLVLIDSCKRASAERVTAVLPYFGYARQDRKDEGRVPITAKLVANLITRAGADRVLTMDLHAAQIQGFFDVPVDHLYAAPVLNQHFIGMNIAQEDMVIVSPDEGSIKRALGHAKRLGGTMAIIDKRRVSPERTVQANILGGDVKGKIALMFDDMISTAGSIRGAAQVLHDHGVREIHVGVTHAVLCGNAMDNLRSANLSSLICTDSIPLNEDQILPQTKILSVAPLLGEAIKRIHRNESVSGLFR